MSDIGTLALSRKALESIQIGDDISIQVVAILPEKVKLCIRALKSIPITRTELLPPPVRETTP